MIQQWPRTSDMVDPLEIYQTMLDFVSGAVLRGDLARYLSAVILPYTIHTESARFELARAEDLAATFLSASGELRHNGVTDYIRLGREARYVSRRQIEGTHYTHLMRGTTRIAPPYVASQTLVSDGAVWRFSAARYAIANDRLPLGLPIAGRDPDRLPFHPEVTGGHV